MTDSIPENNYHPYTYNFNTFLKNHDDRSFLVSELLKTRKGNCVSMPMMYKLLANELGVQAHLATAPMHVFIKHQDESGKWWNVEMTTGSFSRTSFIIESFGVTDKALQSGLHMKPLSEMETMSYMMNLLLLYYEERTGKYYGDIANKAINEGIKADSVSVLAGKLADSKSFEIYYFFEQNNIPYNNVTKETLKKYNLLDKSNYIQYLRNTLKEFGHSTMTVEQYENNLIEALKFQKEISKGEEQ